MKNKKEKKIDDVNRSKKVEEDSLKKNWPTHNLGGKYDHVNIRELAYSDDEEAEKLLEKSKS